jgi:hypothetical protein
MRAHTTEKSVQKSPHRAFETFASMTKTLS